MSHAFRAERGARYEARGERSWPRNRSRSPEPVAWTARPTRRLLPSLGGTMSSLRRIACGMAAGGTLALMALSSAGAQNWNTCPSLGPNSSNTAGCAVLITVGPGGTLNILLNPTNSQPYDGSDDALVGVVNNS